MKRAGWDESKSEQWRYLLRKESDKRRAIRNADALLLNEGEIKRNKPGKKINKSKIIKGRKRFNKMGKEIVYSASPGAPDSFSNLKQQRQHPTNDNETTTREITRLLTESKTQE